MSSLGCLTYSCDLSCHQLLNTCQLHTFHLCSGSQMPSNSVRLFLCCATKTIPKGSVLNNNHFFCTQVGSLSRFGRDDCSLLDCGWMPHLQDGVCTWCQVSAGCEPRPQPGLWSGGPLCVDLSIDCLGLHKHRGLLAGIY